MSTQKCRPCEVGAPKFFSGFRNVVISVFNEVKRDAPGFNEVKQKANYEQWLYELYPIVDAVLFRWHILHVDAEISPRGSWESQIIFAIPNFQNFGIGEVKCDTPGLK